MSATVDVQVQRAEATPLAVVRRQVGLSELASVVPECCGLVWEAVKAQRVPAGRHVALYWDASIRLEVGVELQGAFVDDGDVVASATPAGMVASTIHLGPYGGLGAAHDAIRRWCAERGHRLAGPSWEIYGHWRPEWDADPSQIRTDVCYLIAT
jgi:effector-binding domain-containing protein